MGRFVTANEVRSVTAHEVINIIVDGDPVTADITIYTLNSIWDRSEN